MDDDDPRGTVILEPLAILPEEQRRGLGKLLVSSIFKIIPDVTYIGLATHKINKIAIATYEALGFVQRQTDLRDRSVPMEYKAENSDILQKTAKELNPYLFV